MYFHFYFILFLFVFFFSALRWIRIVLLPERRRKCLTSFWYYAYAVCISIYYSFSFSCLQLVACMYKPATPLPPCSPQEHGSINQRKEDGSTNQRWKRRKKCCSSRDEGQGGKKKSHTRLFALGYCKPTRSACTCYLSASSLSPSSLSAPCSWVRALCLALLRFLEPRKPLQCGIATYFGAFFPLALCVCVCGSVWHSPSLLSSMAFCHFSKFSLTVGRKKWQQEDR